MSKRAAFFALWINLILCQIIIVKVLAQDSTFKTVTSFSEIRSEQIVITGSEEPDSILKIAGKAIQQWFVEVRDWLKKTRLGENSSNFTDILPNPDHWLVNQ